MKEKIRKLAKERNAIILSHNYQPPEIQDIADLCGDSLELSIKAAHTDAEIIVFCGVHFMAETAAILSPDKTVLIPRRDAGCPMADMITPEALRKKMETLPPMPVVTYVNSTAAVKALSTICCTSANAIEVVESLDSEEVLMIPDRNLGKWAALHTKKKVHLWDGYCPFHDNLRPEDVQLAKTAHPEAIFMAHPECRSEVLEMADVVVSTSGMIKFAESSDVSSFIVGTEVGLIYPLEQARPDKKFYPASPKVACADMKKITLHDVVDSLEFMKEKVTVPEDIRVMALQAVQRMVNL